jgi:phenylpropionate dioxygenase-like ring-hydroxylating dioxygenase large terminal subunit
MTLELGRRQWLDLVDRKKGLVDRRIFHDADIYQLELERIFARAWNFVAHETQIPNPGDFFMNYIGEDRVIVVRDNDALPQVLINSCRHRGNAVCRAEEGHATSFMCTYHGWTYDLKGRLVGVPGFKEVYHEELDRENWGLIKAAQVDSYKGFIFANMDPEAPGLHEYLGEVGRIGLNQLAARDDLKIVKGIQKWTIDCNWKFAADNVWDYYHGALTHASAGMAGWRFATGEAGIPQTRSIRPTSAPNRVLFGEYGHAVGGPQVTDFAMTDTTINKASDQTWRNRPDALAALGPVGQRAGGHLGLFPNFWLMNNQSQVALRLPKGPRKTEIWWFTTEEQGLDDEQKRIVTRRATRHNGPAGLTEIDDGENWSQSTAGTRGAVSRNYPFHYGMNVGRSEMVQEPGPPHVDTAGFSEHAQLWYYRNWSEWMAAESWGEYRALHSKPEGRV